MAERKRSQRCQKCGLHETKPIMYGFPSMEMFTLAERGDIALGGCLVEMDQPNWYCSNCEHEWLESGDDAENELRKLLRAARKEVRQKLAE